MANETETGPEPPKGEPGATSVVIFGAGITGLTAAHELADRGFRVTVYDPSWLEPYEAADVDGTASDGRLGYEPCGIGGIARSQWARVDPPIDPGEPQPRLKQAGTATVWLTQNDIVRFENRGVRLDLGFRNNQKVFEKVLKALDERPRSTLTVNGWTNHPGSHLLEGDLEDDSSHEGGGSTEDDDSPGGDLARARAVARALQDESKTRGDIRFVGRGMGYPDDPSRTKDDRCFVSFTFEEDTLPGEHGFRYFPSFYKHLFDTLRRIPLPDTDDDPLAGSGRSVSDNLVPTTSQSLNYRGRDKPLVFPRAKLSSLREAFELLRRSLVYAGFTFDDIYSISKSLLKYMTSCSARRANEYEDISWFDFAQAKDTSEAFQTYLEATPQLLLALRAREADARSIGNAVVQLFMDELVGRDRTDGVLNGPTSIAWFRHWRAYLRSQLVEFRRGSLEKIVCLSPADGLLKCQVKLDGSDQVTLLDDPAYVVIALPVDVAQEKARALSDTGYKDPIGDIDAIQKIDLTPLTPDNPCGEFGDLNGIQFYLSAELKLSPGHTVYPNAEWGLSSIFQPQFWTRRRGPWSAIRGILSVCIGDWHTPSREGPCQGKTAWDCTPDEIAQEVWRQIAETVPKELVPVPTPMYYHLDSFVKFERRRFRQADGAVTDKDCPGYNAAPYLLNRTGCYQRRPGHLPPSPSSPDGYRIYPGNVVFAGTYVKTWTRLTTMEAANESARHAVNAILADFRYAGDWCFTRNPEDDELPDLLILKELDAKLMKHDLPHFLDILSPPHLPPHITDIVTRLLPPILSPLASTGGSRGLRFSKQPEGHKDRSPGGEHA